MDDLSGHIVDGIGTFTQGVRLQATASACGKYSRSDGNAFVESDLLAVDLVGAVKGAVPIGGVVPFLKSLSGTPTLPTDYVECNGQVLSDAASVFNGVTLPDLNGALGAKRFLRGSATSGATGGSDSHSHSIATGSFGPCTGASTYGCTGSTGTASTLPSYYEVVHVIRIK